MQAEQAAPTEPIPQKSLLIKTDKPRPYVCATCTRSFARLEHLKRHERSHTKEKPFQCPVCERSFARRDLLLRHKQKLHASFSPPKSDDVKERPSRYSSSGSQRFAATPGAGSGSSAGNTPTGTGPSGVKYIASPRSTRSLNSSQSPVASTSTDQINANGSQYRLSLNPLEHELDSMRHVAPPFRVLNRESRASSFSASSGPYLYDHASTMLGSSDVQFSTPQAYPTDAGNTPDLLDLSMGMPMHAGAGSHARSMSYSHSHAHHQAPAAQSAPPSGASASSAEPEGTINPQMLRSGSKDPYDHNGPQQPEGFSPRHFPGQAHTPLSAGSVTPSPFPYGTASVPSRSTIPTSVGSASSVDRHRSLSISDPNYEFQEYSPAYSIPSVATVSNWDSPMAHVPSAGQSGYAFSPPEGAGSYHRGSISAMPPNPQRRVSRPLALSTKVRTSEEPGKIERSHNKNDDFMDRFLNLEEGSAEFSSNTYSTNDDWSLVDSLHLPFKKRAVPAQASQSEGTIIFPDYGLLETFSPSTAEPPSGISTFDALEHRADYGPGPGGADLTSLDKNLYAMMTSLQSQDTENQANFEGAYTSGMPDGFAKQQAAQMASTPAESSWGHSSPEPAASRNSLVLPQASASQLQSSVPLENRHRQQEAAVANSFMYASAQNLPSSQEMRRFVAAYYQDFHHHIPLVHRSMPLTAKNMALVMIMAASGALFSKETAVASHLYDVSKDWVYNLSDRYLSGDLQGTPAPLWLIQAATLTSLHSLFHERVEENESAFLTLQRTVALARMAKLNVPPQQVLPKINWNSASVTTRWQHFLECQARIRTVYGIFLINASMSGLYGYPIILTKTDLEGGTPCDENIWAAPNAEKWWEIIKANDLQKHIQDKVLSGPDFTGTINTLLSGHILEDPVPQMLFSCLLPIAYVEGNTAISDSDMYTLGQDEEVVRLTDTGTVAVKAWNASWARMPRSVVESCALLEDSIPRRSILMIKFYVDLLHVKQRFWARDYVGMNHELEALRHNNPEGLIDASGHALETILLGETQVKNHGKLFSPVLHGLFECGLVLSLGLEIIESMSQPKEKHQELLMRSHKLFTRVLEGEASGGFFNQDPDEPLGHVALRIVTSIIRRAVTWPFSTVILDALESRL